MKNLYNKFNWQISPFNMSKPSQSVNIYPLGNPHKIHPSIHQASRESENINTDQQSLPRKLRTKWRREKNHCVLNFIHYLYNTTIKISHRFVSFCSVHTIAMLAQYLHKTTLRKVCVCVSLMFVYIYCLSSLDRSVYPMVRRDCLLWLDLARSSLLCVHFSEWRIGCLMFGNIGLTFKFFPEFRWNNE